MRGTINLLIPLTLTLAITTTACHSSKKTGVLTPRSVTMGDRYTGDWDFIVKDTPSGDAQGVMNIEKDGFAYRANVSADIGEMSIDHLTIQEERLKGYFHYKGFKVNVKGNFVGDTFEGKVGMTLLSYPFVAKKRLTDGRIDGSPFATYGDE